MSLQRVKIEISHTFDLDIPDELLDEDGWDLHWYVAEAFEDQPWEFNNVTINEIRENK
jgi:hypothetical protein